MTKTEYDWPTWTSKEDKVIWRVWVPSTSTNFMLCPWMRKFKELWRPTFEILNLYVFPGNYKKKYNFFNGLWCSGVLKLITIVWDSLQRWIQLIPGSTWNDAWFGPRPLIRIESGGPSRLPWSNCACKFCIMIKSICISIQVHRSYSCFPFGAKISFLWL